MYIISEFYHWLESQCSHSHSQTIAQAVTKQQLLLLSPQWGPIRIDEKLLLYISLFHTIYLFIYCMKENLCPFPFPFPEPTMAHTHTNTVDGKCLENCWIVDCRLGYHWCTHWRLDNRLSHKICWNCQNKPRTILQSHVIMYRFFYTTVK